MVHIHFCAPTMSVDLRLFQLTGCGGLDHFFCVHDSVRILAGPTGFSGGGFVFKFDGLVFNGPPAAGPRRRRVLRRRGLGGGGIAGSLTPR